MPANFANVICAIAALSLVTACGGANGTSTTMPQTPAHKTAHPGWVAPDSSGADLLYVSDNATADVYVLSYRAGQLVGTLSGVHFPLGLCVDRSGNVFVADEGGQQVLEYAHGGTQPITVFQDREYPDACSVDRTTGNLAVANESGNVSVYPNATSQPKIYSTPFVPWFCAYDNVGNLFAAGSGLKISIAELPRGGSAFKSVSYEGRNNGEPAGLQWVGKHLTFGSASRYSGHCCGRIWRYLIKDLRGKRAGSRHISGQMINFFIEGSTAIVVTGTGRIALYDYPKGDNAPKVIKEPSDKAYSAVVSTASLRH